VRRVAPAGDDAARARLDALFDAFDRLTPDELARIGLVRADPSERHALHSTVTAAARSAGRSALLSELAALAGAWGFGIGMGAGLVGGVIGFGGGLLIVGMATRIRLADGGPRRDQDPAPPAGG
jgi:hypothetical protein